MFSFFFKFTVSKTLHRSASSSICLQPNWATDTSGINRKLRRRRYALFLWYQREFQLCMCLQCSCACANAIEIDDSIAHNTVLVRMVVQLTKSRQCECMWIKWLKCRWHFLTARSHLCSINIANFCCCCRTSLFFFLSRFCMQTSSRQHITINSIFAYVFKFFFKLHL